MKLLATVFSLAIVILTAGTVDAKQANTTQDVQKIKQVQIESIVDDIAVPIYVLIILQKDNPGHAVIEAQALEAGGETTYQLRVSNDTSNSPEDRYALYDNDWKAIEENGIPFLPTPKPIRVDNNDNTDEEIVDEPEAIEDVISKPEVKEPVSQQEIIQVPAGSSPADTTQDEDNELEQQQDSSHSDDDEIINNTNNENDDQPALNEDPG